MQYKLILINPRFTENVTLFNLPINILHLGSFIKSKHYDVEVLDAVNSKNDNEFCNNMLLPRLHAGVIIGITAMSTQIPSAMFITEFIKSMHPNIKIVWGGVHPTLYPEQVSDYKSVDFIVAGHGEQATLHIMQSMESGEKLTRIIKNDYPEIAMDDLPKIDPDLVLGLSENFNSIREISNKSLYGFPIITGKGCPHRCIGANELISMEDGSFKLIAEIHKNDRILSIDDNGQIKSGIVSKAMETGKCVKIISIKTNNQKLLCTSDHMIMTRNGWIEAGKLKKGVFIGTSRTYGPRQAKTTRSTFEVLGESRRYNQKARSCIEKCDKNAYESSYAFSGDSRKESAISAVEPGSSRSDNSKNDTEQSYERSCNCSKSEQYYDYKAFKHVIRKGETAAFKWKYSETCIHTRNTGKESTANADKQSYEKSGCGKKTIRNYEEKICRESGYVLEQMVSEIDRSELSRGNSGANYISNGIQICGGFEVLDRSLSEWDAKESRFHSGEWKKQDSDFVQFGLLAPISRDGCNRIKRLSNDGMESFCSDRNDAEGSRCIESENYGVVEFDKVIAIEDAGVSSVWDIETYPYHNFIASGIVVHNCIFCINSILHEKYVRKSSTKIIENIEYIVNNLGITKIWFVDEDFFGDKKRAKEFIDAVIEKKIKFSWNASVRTDYFGESYLGAKGYLERLELTGCKIIGTGAESGSDRILKKVSKDIKVEDTIHMAELVSKTGMIANFSFMIGLPGETVSDYRKTLQLMSKLIDIDYRFYTFGPQIYRPYPGSKLYDECLTYGMHKPNSLKEWSESPYIHFEFSKNSYFDKKLYPWVEYDGDLTNIVFYATLMGKKPGNKIVTKLLRGMGKWRCMHFNFRFPIEKKLYGLMRGAFIERMLRRWKIV